MPVRPQIRLAGFPDDATCAVTTSWDDNDRLNMELLKILDSFKLKGTFYIDPGNTTYQNGSLNKRELRILASNQEVGSHTWSHVDLTRCSKKFLQHEYRKSKRYLEDVTGKPVVALAYPYSAYSHLARKIARECGYLCARTTHEGQIEFPPSDPYLWGITVSPQKRFDLLPTLLSKRRLLTLRGQVYARNLVTSWRGLALKLFEKARKSRGVWHLFGHATDVLQPDLKQEFLEVCRYIARRRDIWYATNGMLFVNEVIKRRTQITQKHFVGRSSFQVAIRPSVGVLIERTPLPLSIHLPEARRDEWKTEVHTGHSGKAEVGGQGRNLWINIFDHDAEIVISRK